MEKLKMHTPDLTEENFRKLAALFPNAVTETANENGEIVRAIDADVLRQEISAEVVEGRKERYQFTWPDKKKSVVLANAPIAKTLRLEREKSVGPDGTEGSTDTENIYIEGDNLDALKLLRETYLGQVKMIYIDPPYNTKKDSFIYDDDFTMPGTAFAENSGAVDENGNQMFDLRVNNENNGRFHTDWLNMIYPRLRLARDLLADDGVIFISIDDHEQENLKKICNEIFGAKNFVSLLKWKRKKQPSFLSVHVASVMEYVLVFAKKAQCLGKLSIEKTSDATKKVINISNKESERLFKAGLAVKSISNGTIPRGVYTIKTMTVEYKDDIIVKDGKTENEVKVVARFLNTQDKIDQYIKQGLLFITANNGLRRYVSEEEKNKEKSIIDLLLDWGDNQDSDKEQTDLLKKKFFDYTKPVLLIKNLSKALSNKEVIILDFFSGSATTAHAVMQLNAEDGGNRKFIMVQLPEVTAAKSEARKAGYHTICDIGEERIRRAGKKIKEETGADIDYGFRVLRVDSTNMRDVYYRTQDLKQTEIELLADNIKEDRTPEDLLFQVMLDLGILLSSKIEEKNIAGKKVFMVDDGYLIACFDVDVTEEVVTAIAQENPIYAVFRDSSIASDAVMTNFEQIFKTHSPQTEWKVL